MLRTSIHSRKSIVRAVIGTAVILTILKVWVEPSTLLARAQAQIPDSGKQRALILQETREINRQLADIVRLLKSGSLHVHIQSADNQETPRPRSGTGP